MPYGFPVVGEQGNVFPIQFLFGGFPDGGGFDPNSLFANGERGVWLDPSDLSTMFVDLAGTTPVTTDGDPVGYMVDKANGHVFTAPEDAARPIYRTDGILHWLAFDGTDSLLETSPIAGIVDAVDGFMGVVAAEYDSSVAFGQYDFDGVDDRVWRFDDDNDETVAFTVQPNNSFLASRTATEPVGVFSGVRILAGTWQGDNTKSTLAINRSNVFEAENETTLNDPVTTSVQLGKLGTEYWDFDFYGAIVRDVYNSTAVTNAEDWAAGKAGVTL